MRAGFGATALLAGGLAASACRPGAYEYYDQTDLILTVKEPDRDFAGFQTWALWPEVIDLASLVEDPIDINHGVVDPVLIEGVESNMEALGWTQVADATADDPDVVMVIGTVASDNWYFYSYSYWYDYWYWYYPGYYPPVYAVNYPSGSVFLIMVKPDEAVDDGEGNLAAPVIWTGAIWGELSDSTSANLDRVSRDIDQAFDQSPYLDR